MEPKSINMVTVVFRAELRLLKLQARSISRYLDPDCVGTLFIISNDPYKKWLADYFKRHILPEYGQLQSRVRFLDIDDVWQGASRRFDWQSQQVLKMLVARLVKTGSYLVLDAKNHFVRPVTREAFFAADGRRRSHLNPMAPKYWKHLAAACELFGIPAPTEGRLLPTTTPFLADTGLVLAMLAEIEGRTGQPFERFFMQGKGRFTEFTLYCAYHLKARGAIDATYEERSGPTATLFSGARARPDRANAVMDRLHQDEGVYCMGVHRSVLEQADGGVIPAVKAAWRQFGLVDSATEATYFCETETVPYLDRIRRFFSR